MTGGAVLRDQALARPIGIDDDGGDVADPRVSSDAGVDTDNNQPPRRPPGRTERPVDIFDDSRGRQLVFALKRGDRLARRIMCGAAVPEAVGYHHRETVVAQPPVPVVAADLF